MLFSCSIRAIYNRVHRAQNKRLMMNSYILGMNTSILPKRHDENIFSEKLVNGLHSWIKNHPHLIHYTKFKRLIVCKNNGTFLEKQKHRLQILARDLHNDMIVPISEGVFRFKNS